MLFQQLDPGFDRAWQKPVVVIEKQYIFALAMQDTRIACSSDPAIRLVYVTNSTRPCNFRCLIGRSIIDHDNFDPESFNGSLASGPNFGNPSVAFNPRQIQFGVRVVF